MAGNFNIVGVSSSIPASNLSFLPQDNVQMAGKQYENHWHAAFSNCHAVGIEFPVTSGANGTMMWQTYSYLWTALKYSSFKMTSVVLHISAAMHQEWWSGYTVCQ
jgi:hypothetical protein